MSKLLATIRAQYERDGFFLSGPIVPQPLIERVIPHMHRVMMGSYETQIPPIQRNWNPGDDQHKLRKIDQAHRCDRTIWELVTFPEIGRLAATVTGAEWIQAWAVQLLYKPPGGTQSGNIGWHQDINYWKPSWKGEVFTAWVAISDVPQERGPMIFVRGSHKWGEKNGNFWNTDRDAQRESMEIPEGQTWEEVPGVLPAGGISFHHHFTLHGSGPNQDSQPRLSFAIHLRTEKSEPITSCTEYPVYTASYMPHLDNPDM